MINLTRAQRVSLHRKWKQSNQDMTYRNFRKTVQPMIGDNCVMVRWCGMWCGIEIDGHVHA